jgi:hypothetical protein
MLYSHLSSRVRMWKIGASVIDLNQHLVTNDTV